MKAVATRQPHRRRNLSQGLYYIILIALALFALGPLLVLAFNSVKSDAEIGINPLGVPQVPDFGNFLTAWVQGGFATTMRNSVIITGGTVIGVCIIAGMAAYALTHLDLPGGSAVLVYLTAGTAIPVQLFLVPLFFLWSNLNLTDNLFGLIIIYWAINSPFATLLLRSFFLSIPREFDDAARVDGANELGVLRYILLPLAWPGFLTISLVAGLAAWNEFFLAIIFIQNDALKPISTSFLSFQQAFSTQWGLTSAAALIMIVPVIVLFLLLQRRFIAGLTAGGLK